MAFTGTILGNICSEPELKMLPGGTALLKFRIATNERVKVGGEYKEHATFVAAHIWGKQAESLAPHLAKGKQVFISGTVSNREYEKDGQKRTSLEIKVSEFSFVSGGDRDKGSAPKGDAGRSSEDADDIPF